MIRHSPQLRLVARNVSLWRTYSSHDISVKPPGTVSGAGIGAGPTGVVLINMGGPATVPETHDFLLRLFSDGDLIPLGPFQKQVAKFIAWRRYKTIEKHYQEIGGGSPILRYSREQAKQACEQLDRLRPQSAPHIPYVAFRYAPPFTIDVYKQMLSDGIKQAVFFTQYPQYSFSTTRSNYNDLVNVRKRIDPDNKISWSYIYRWPTHPKFIATVAKKVRAALAEFSPETRDEVMVLFSAHSLPMTVVNRGDPYVAEVAASAYAVMQNMQFSNPYRVTWQSQVGPQPWLGAQTQRALETLEKDPNYKGAVVVPIAFTTDHIETLHEIDIEMKEELKKPELMRRAESLNLDPDYIDAMASMLAEHLDGNVQAEVASGAGIKPVFPPLR